MLFIYLWKILKKSTNTYLKRDSYFNSIEFSLSENINLQFVKLSTRQNVDYSCI